MNPFVPSADSSEAPERPPAHVRLARALAVDSAVGYAVLSRVWQLLTGPVTQLLIVIHLTPGAHDYYVAFSSMLGLQIFVELGLHVVLINVASHEWSRLSLVDGRVTGDPVARSRLMSLGKLMLRWYSVAALIFALAVTIAGSIFFRDAATPPPDAAEVRQSVAWFAPWLVLVLLNALQLSLLPLTAILEGCNQLAVINRTRFWQGVIGTLLVTMLLATGGGLWALAGSAAVRLAGEAYLVTGRYRRFFVSLQQPVTDGSIHWRSEILPLQWRIAVQGILLWMVNQMPVLVVFRYFGEGQAARLGMTWTILTALQSASLAWIETRRPRFGSLIAAGDYQELDRLFFHLTRMSLSIMAVGATAFTAGVWFLGTRSESLLIRLSGRLLPVAPTALFAVALTLLQFALCTNLYVRAHKRDPFLTASIVSGLTIAGLEFWLGRLWGVTGVAAGYAIGVSLVQVPLWTVIWWSARRQWHPGGAAHV